MYVFYFGFAQLASSSCMLICILNVYPQSPPYNDLRSRLQREWRRKLLKGKGANSSAFLLQKLNFYGESVLKFKRSHGPPTNLPLPTVAIAMYRTFPT